MSQNTIPPKWNVKQEMECVRHALMLTSVVLEDAMYILIQVYASAAVKDVVYARTRNTGCDCWGVSLVKNKLD